MLSVSSTTRQAGSRPIAASVVNTSVTTSGCRIWRADTLTLISSVPRSGYCAPQSRACVIAVVMTQRPRSRIRPLSSATRMNSSGPTGPWTGWSHRASASKPVSDPVRSEKIGW